MANQSAGGSNGTLVLSTVPVGNTGDGSYLVTVHVAPSLNSGISPSVLQNWASDVASGNLSFALISPQLANPLPATLDISLIHPELWVEFFGDVTALTAKSGSPASPAIPAIGNSKVNLKSTLDNADEFYKGYVNSVDVTNAQSISNLYNNTVTLACKHSVYGLNKPCPDGRVPGSNVRTYLNNNLGRNRAATRIFGNVNVDAAFPPNGIPQTLNALAESEIDMIHKGQHQTDNGAGSRQHIVHHIHRLRSISRQAPTNIAQSSLNATATAAGRVLTPMNFSQRITLLQGMPVLMEALGLVLVFHVPGGTSVSAIQKLTTNASYNGTSGSYSNMTIVSPWTAVNGALFIPQSLPNPVPAGSIQNPNPVIRSDNGYIDVNSNADYWMGSLQQESAANHVYNFANRAVVRLNRIADPTRAVTLQANEDYTHVILPPSPHTDGLYVYQHGRQNKILQKLQQAAAVPAPTNDTVRYAEDLFHSFAVDMKADSLSNWSHLSLRDEKYFRCADKKHAIITATDREHGVRSSAVRPTDSVPTMSPGESAEATKHQMDETIFTWRGGSLAVRDSSAPIPSQTEGSLSTQEIPWGDKFRGEFTIADNAKIPGQVFGAGYSFALRPIYITGRARPFDPDAASASIIPNAVKFLRNEMVLGPRLIKKEGTGSSCSDTQNLMFVSSRVKNPREILAADQMNALEVSGVIESSLRYLVPAACTPAMAKRHGKSADAIARGAKTVPMKKGKKGKNDGALPDTLPIKREEIDETTIYIPDPMCDGVRASLFFIGNAPLPDSAHQLTVTLPYYKQGNSWPDYTLHCVELRREKPGSPPQLTREDTFWGVNHVALGGEFGSKTIVCTLPPGMTAVLELTPTILDDARNTHAFAPQSTALEDTTICRPTILRMTHATDVPVTAPDFYLDGAVLQKNGPRPIIIDGMELYSFDRSVCATPGVTTTYEPYTTGKVSIEASWTEVVDTPADKKNPSPVRLPQKAAIFSRPLPKLRATKVGADIGSVYDSDDSCPTGSSCPPPSTAGTPCPTAKLPFNDSRYRRVQLAMSGISRYETVVVEKKHGAEAARKALYDFLSTAAPSVPDIEYVLPTFEWRFAKKFHVHSQTRKCGLAVMLNRPWFVSGEGEQLAVLLPSSSQCGPAQIPSLQSVQLPSQYPPPQGSSNGTENTVSAWGTHAIWNFAENNTMTIGIENASSCESLEVKGQTYNFALFDPIFDEVEQRWYCNLSFSEPPVYGTLMRLILARYQGHSAKPEWTLSPPAIADFAFLSPERVVRIKRSWHWNSLDLAISGVGAYDPGGKLQTRFDVHVATEKDHDTTDFPWREPESFVTDGTSDRSRNVLWHGPLKFDPLATNTIVIREYEVYPAFEAQPISGSAPMRDRLVYASSIDIPAYL